MGTLQLNNFLKRTAQLNVSVLPDRLDGNIQLRVPFEPASLYNSPYAFSHLHNGFCSLQRVPDQITVWQDFIWFQEQHNR